MKARLWIALAIALGGAGVSIAAQKTGRVSPEAGPMAPAETNNLFASAFGTAKQFRADIHEIKRFGSAQEEQTAYERMVAQMSVPPQLAHLSFPDEDTTREWTVDAKVVAKGIKPQINYQVVNGETPLHFQGTPAIQQNLQDNVRIIAWYRDQIEEVCPKEEEATGPHALARIIDAFLDKFANAVPPVTIKMQGKMNQPKDQKIEYSHREVWEILATVNRYFFYKVQIYGDDVKDYYPADTLLMGSMVRTAAIYGAPPSADGLTKIESRLEPDSPDWRADAYDALKSWDEVQKQPERYPQQLCKIKIPESPLAKTAAPVVPAFPPDVEDVKELGGQIFIKRKGYWSVWEKK